MYMMGKEFHTDVTMYMTGKGFHTDVTMCMTGKGFHTDVTAVDSRTMSLDVKVRFGNLSLVSAPPLIFFYTETQSKLLKMATFIRLQKLSTIILQL